jgi:hypothetical protein
MDKGQFSSKRATGRALLEIGFPVVKEAEPNLAEAIQAWIQDTWMPKNKEWNNKSRLEPRLVLYRDTFYSEPKISESSGLLILNLDTNLSSKEWRDWLVLKIIRDMRERFPIIGEPLHVRHYRVGPS